MSLPVTKVLRICLTIYTTGGNRLPWKSILLRHCQIDCTSWHKIYFQLQTSLQRGLRWSSFRRTQSARSPSSQNRSSYPWFCNSCHTCEECVQTTSPHRVHPGSGMACRWHRRAAVFMRSCAVSHNSNESRGGPRIGTHNFMLHFQ